MSRLIWFHVPLKKSAQGSAQGEDDEQTAVLVMQEKQLALDFIEGSDFRLLLLTHVY